MYRLITDVDDEHAVLKVKLQRNLIPVDVLYSTVVSDVSDKDVAHSAAAASRCSICI